MARIWSVFQHVHPSERPWARTGARIGYGLCVVLGCLGLGCAPWLLAVWAITGRNDVIGRFLVGSILIAGICIVTAQWLNAKAGGRVDF